MYKFNETSSEGSDDFNVCRMS